MTWEKKQNTYNDRVCGLSKSSRIHFLGVQERNKEAEIKPSETVLCIEPWA